ncbi:hypothetical protein [Flavobacterium lipolyticum]|uniref:Uncharacterized protein n=1 Tax=Flavobacterium lipolyticum TaxID=2893754 RepID=A0ABS8M4P1_9FLAO|nr:hypothetical protein [Flavobacterium sp. F-126]MCC9019783.1 hypothetical protein [Flavobacterium sp. F-126]
MKNFPLVITFLLPLICFCQSDKDFKFIAKDNDGEKIYITSPEKDSDYLKFWISHTVPIRPIKNAELKELFFGGNRELMLIELKCLEKTYNLIKVITYDKKGKIEKSENAVIRLEKIYPESFMDIVAREVCNL